MVFLLVVMVTVVVCADRCGCGMVEATRARTRIGKVAGDTGLRMGWSFDDAGKEAC